MGPQEPQVPQAPQVPEQPQQPVPQPEMQPQAAPQPSAQPVAPQQPFGPQQFGPAPVGAAPQMPKKSKKGLVIGLVAGGVGLLLLIAGIIVAVLLLGPPSKADFQKAYDKTTSMTTKYDGFDSDTEFANLKTVSEIRKKFGELKATYDKDNAELAGMKAMNDADVKKAYNDYRQKYDAAMPVAEASVSVAGACYSEESSLSGIYDAKTKQAALDAFDAAMKDCLPALKDISNSSNSDVASYGKVLYDYMRALRIYYGDVVGAYATNDFSAASKLKLPETPDSEKINLTNDKYDFTGGFDTLRTVLRDKANK